MDEEQTQD